MCLLPQKYLSFIRPLTIFWFRVGQRGVALRIQRRVESDLQLPHVDVERIASCLCDPEALQDLLERLYVQTEKARKVFALLDHAGKGVVVLEDLQTVLSNDQVLQNEVGDDNLEEMMQAVDTSGDGLLTCDDMIRIARTVGL